MRQLAKFKYAVFDLDGTLFDTIEDIMNSGNELLAMHGMNPYTLGDYKLFVGLGVDSLIASIFKGRKTDEDEHLLRKREYLEIYQRRMLETTSLYPGIADLISRLREEGVKLAILSNKQDQDVLLIVEHFNLKSAFEIVLGKRPELPIKPHPESLKLIIDGFGARPEEVVYIGDTKTDIETAKNASVAVIGVTWGFRPRRELVEAGADYIVDDPIAILEIVKG